MDKNNKTVGFRVDEETLNKMEFIKTSILKNSNASHSEVLRRSINFMYENKEQALLEKGDVFEYVKDYINVALLKFEYPDENLDKDNLPELLLYELNKVYEEYSLEEITELGTLCDEENPITLAKLIRFKSRELPELFLSLMDVRREAYKDLSDDELAEFIVIKFANNEFKQKASEHFNMVF